MPQWVKRLSGNLCPNRIPKKRHADDLSGSEKRMQQPQTDKFGKEQYKIKMSSALREALSERDSEKADNTNDPNEIPKKRHADGLSGFRKADAPTADR